MTAELRILRGARTGEVFPITREITIGRQAGVDLRFDPQRDTDVSAQHATVGYDGLRWFVRDAGSRNGTFVNGERVALKALRHGDRIRFGWDGPEVEFRIPGAEDIAVPVSGEAAVTPAGRDPIVAQNRRLKIIIGALLVMLAAMAYASRVQQQRQQAERSQLLARIDRVLATGDTAVRALAGQREELAQALQRTQAEVRAARDGLQRATSQGDRSQEKDLKRQLQSALAALERQQLAASIDYASIERVSRPAVAVIYVETAGGVVVTGTAFAVRPDATLITCRHIVQSDDLQPPKRMAVQFAGSNQVFPAHVLAIADFADIAVIKVDNIEGDVPVVRGLNLHADTVRAGAPVAWIGFPLGGETWPQDVRTGRLARPLGSVGVVNHVASDHIEVQGYGAAGASGSPLFDENGEVLAIIYGGRREATGQILMTSPATQAARLLDTLR